MSDHRGNNNRWAEHRVEKLRKLWAEGKSGTEIAEILGGDATRASVIGKANRLGLTSRASPANFRTSSVSAIGRQPAPLQVKPDKYAGNGHNARGGRISSSQERGGAYVAGQPIASAYVDTIEAANDTAFRLIDRSRLQCSWPVGVPARAAEQLCCGQPVQEGANPSVESYCPRHATQAVSRAFTRGKPDAKVYERAMRRFA